MQIINFSINGLKSTLFITIFSVILYAIYNFKLIKNIIPIISLLGIVGIIETLISKSHIIIDYLIRRVMFIPNLLNYYYWDYFSVHRPDFFQQGFLRYLGFNSSYTSIPKFIGYIYFGNPNNSANNGLFSDAMVNLGFGEL